MWRSTLHFVWALIAAFLILSVEVRSQSFASAAVREEINVPASCEVPLAPLRLTLGTGYLSRLTSDKDPQGVFEIGRVTVMVERQDKSYLKLRAIAPNQQREPDTMELALVATIAPSQITDGFAVAGTMDVVQTGMYIVKSAQTQIHILTVDPCQQQFMQKLDQMPVQLTLRVAPKVRVLQTLNKLQ
ncbi:MAG: hypothetical protein KW802_03785 [Candidatus Doudnabacteria bacterium]|nr:hypothetical protein [Candidatus Doudnabacteria bacterium]